MTPHQVSDLVAALEKDLADFYADLGRVERLKPYADIFSFMSDHSQRHARQVEAAARHTLPELDPAPIETLHRRVKEGLKEQVLEAQSGDRVLSLLARAEEIVGELYQSIADHYRKQAAILTGIAEQFTQLSRDELDHRDFIRDRQDG